MTDDDHVGSIEHPAHGRADERERSFVHAVARLLRADGPEPGAALVRHVHDHPRDALAEGLRATLARIRAAAELPVAVGFGISTSEQASAVADLADGVIVGSRIVRAAGDGGPEAVGRTVAELARALG